MTDNLLIKNILQPQNNNKYVWNIINNYNTLSQEIEMPTNAHINTVNDFITMIIKKINTNIVSSKVLNLYDNKIISSHNNIIFYKPILLQINGKRKIHYKSNIMHHFTQNEMWNTNKENRSIINSFLNLCINESIMLNNNCTILITNQKLVRNPNNTDIIVPILELKQYVIIPEINNKYLKNIYNFNNLLSIVNDENKIEKMKKKIYDLYENEINKYMFSECLTFNNFFTRYENEQYSLNIFILNGDIKDIMILTTDSSPIILFYTTNVINSNEWFIKKNISCIDDNANENNENNENIVAYVINEQMNHDKLINNCKNTVINVFNVYIHNLYTKIIDGKCFGLMCY